MFSQPTSELQLLVKAINYLRTHWWVFVGEAALLYSMALMQYFRQNPTYESQASLLIDSSRRNLYQSVLMPGMAGANNIARKQNMAHLLTSQEVMERFRSALTDHFNAEGRPAYLRSIFPGGVALSASVLRVLVVLNWDRNSDIYNIRCTADRSDAAHDICLAYLNTIQAYYPEIGERESMLKRDFLSRQIASLTRQVQEREHNLAEFQKKNSDFMDFVILEGTGERGYQKGRRELSTLKQKLVTNRAIKKLMLEVPSAKRGEHTVRASAIDALTQQISELQFQIELTKYSTDINKDEKVDALNKELTRISSNLARLNEEEVVAFMKNPLPSTALRTRMAELELEYRTDVIRVSSLEKELEEIAGREKQFQTEKLEYERLQAELSHRRKLLSNLYTKEQETELELSAGGAEVFRLQEPSRNPNHIAPQLPRYLYGALSMCIFVMLVTLAILMAFFPRLDSEVEVNQLNLPVLGKIPVIRGRGSDFENIPHFGIEYLKIMHYRILRETKDTKCPVIVISSPHSREGKSTAVQLLALASQAPNRKTLVIDGDLLTTHPNRFFGINQDQTTGLKAILEQSNTESPDLLVCKTVHDGVHFLPRGDRMEPSVTTNFLDPLRQVMNVWRKDYDIIFIDTPPQFATNLAHQWTVLADLIVLVARIFVTRPKDITEALQTCKIFSKAPIGIALNCVSLIGPSRRASNYYFSRRNVRPTRLAA